MKTLLIGNGNVITRNPDHPFIVGGCVAVEGRQIKEVGQSGALREKYAGAEWVDAHGGVIMPGLINAHNHIYSAMARGLSIKGHSPANFMDILDGMWWRIDRLLTTEQVRYSALVTYIDCIKNGVTTVFDHHASYGAITGSLFTIADAAKELGVRTCLCYEVSDRDGEEKMKAAVQENEEFIRSAQKDGGHMQKGMMGLHASFTLSDKTLEYCAEHKPDYAGYHIHVAEGLDDVEDSLQKYGKRVVARLRDKGILGEKTIAAHCIHIDEGEMEMLK
ncbi:amidohydrolase family protein, partial [Christensenellaceae bacterium OttesenSCG-928-K19]|nr:amidohydrolase family protein [Christensenellaceae bacterium OttesenSCG-928-K19]